MRAWRPIDIIRPPSSRKWSKASRRYREESFALAEKPLKRDEFHVVGVKRIRHDQLRAATGWRRRGYGPNRADRRRSCRHHRRNIAVRGDEPRGVGRRAALIPAERRRSPVDLRCAVRWRLAMCSLPRPPRRTVLIVDPAIAVAGDFPVRGEHGCDRLRGSAPGPARRRTPSPAGSRCGEQPVQSPEAGAAAVFIEAFHRHRARRMAGGADHFGQEGFRAGIAVDARCFPHPLRN